jgi:hypothetical protein
MSHLLNRLSAYATEGSLKRARYGTVTASNIRRTIPGSPREWPASLMSRRSAGPGQGPVYAILISVGVSTVVVATTLPFSVMLSTVSWPACTTFSRPSPPTAESK